MQPSALALEPDSQGEVIQHIDSALGLLDGTEPAVVRALAYDTKLPKASP